MFFILHYILFNAGLSAILILLALYLQTYSDASLTEIGALLMLLPFVSIVCKPLFCALADRQQAHRQYLAGALLVTAAGYGSIAIAPFFPDFVEKHGRLVWYLDVVGVLVGYSGFGVVWSLGDALAVNMARVKGIPWGSYRVWATVSWGGFGWIVGQINETPLLPKYVPALFVLVGSMTLEAMLVMVWDKRYFDMSADAPEAGVAGLNTGLPLEDSPPLQKGAPPAPGTGGGLDPAAAEIFDEAHWPSAASMTGTLSGSTRTNPRLMGAVANIFMEDIAGSLKSSLRIGAPAKRVALNDLLKQHDLVSSNPNSQKPIIPASPSLPRASSGASGTPASASQQSQQQQQPPLSPIALSKSQVAQLERQDSQRGRGTGGRAAWSRTQLMLSHMNSLSSASGNAIADQLREEFDTSTGSGAGGTVNGARMPAAMIMSSLASNASLGRAAAARAIGFGSSTMKDSMGSSTDSSQQHQVAVPDEDLTQVSGKSATKSVEDLQMVLLKLIIKRDRSILKYLILFTLFGILFAIHISYFFLYVEQLAREKDYDFSSITGMYCLAESVSEIFSFLVIVPYWMPYVGRMGSFITCALMFLTRYLYYGTYFAEVSLYYGLITELCHGIAYGITYTLITDIASECVDQVDSHMPELINRRIIDPMMNPNELKLPLRATMQGVFSGAFDGLGNGLGCLFAGIYLDSFSFAQLSMLCTYLAIAILGIYPLSEWKSMCASSSRAKRQKAMAGAT